MHIRTRDMKARAEELSEGYQEARDEEFTSQFLEEFPESRIEINGITEDDIQGFLDSFTFEDEADWAWSKMESEIDDIGDQMHEQARDERMER